MEKRMYVFKIKSHYFLLQGLWRCYPKIRPVNLVQKKRSISPKLRRKFTLKFKTKVVLESLKQRAPFQVVKKIRHWPTTDSFMETGICFTSWIIIWKRFTSIDLANKTGITSQSFKDYQWQIVSTSWVTFKNCWGFKGRYKRSFPYD